MAIKRNMDRNKKSSPMGAASGLEAKALPVSVALAMLAVGTANADAPQRQAPEIQIGRDGAAVKYNAPDMGRNALYRQIVKEALKEGLASGSPVLIKESDGGEWVDISGIRDGVTISGLEALGAPEELARQPEVWYVDPDDDDSILIWHDDTGYSL
jgi:hypothetical protein